MIVHVITGACLGILVGVVTGSWIVALLCGLVGIHILIIAKEHKQ